MHDASRIPLAIVGMSCRLPGADSLEDYWSLLTEGRSGVGELPPDRFQLDRHFDPTPGNRTRSYTSLGGCVPTRPFDLSRYPIPQWLIDQSADCHLKLCEVAAGAFEHAGWNPLAHPHRNMGVYIGHAPPMSQASRMIFARQIAHTAEFLREIPGFDVLVGGASDDVIREVVDSIRRGIRPDDPEIRLRVHAYYLPALLARQFSLDGPAVAFDAACASSLRALGHGARALQLGEIDVAMIGSASYCHADTLVLFSQAQSVSATGTRPFDDAADGLVAAEGYVILLLKTLERAHADGDRIHAVIRGIGISSDGKGKSLWAPRKEGQMEAVRRAYSDDVAPADLQYIEMHATSTQVGDSTEMSALVEGLAPMLPAGRTLPVGSAKANVGHTLETAGLASLVKTVLAIGHRTIPPQINLHTLNTKIDWEQIPFRPVTSPLAWPEAEPGKPRRAAVNAFGIGGLNVHVVLEEYVPELAQGLVAKEVEQRRLAPSANPDDEAIAIVGIGAILPGVRTVDRLREVLQSGADQRTEAHGTRWNPDIGYAPGEDRLWTIPTRRGGLLSDYEFDWKRHKIPPKQVQTGAKLQFLLLDAADQALTNAGYDKKPFPKQRTGVVVGTIFGSEFGDELQMGLRLSDFNSALSESLARRGIDTAAIAQVAKQYEETLLRRMPALIDETGSFTASTFASRITKTFDLMGGATAVDSGEASSFAALNAAIHLLRTRECDVMVCASGDQSLSFAHFESLARQGKLSKSGHATPFDTSSDGCVPAEGACAVVLKRLSDAKRDGDTIHAIVRGVGAAWDVSIEAGTQRAAARALAKSGFAPSDVAAVETSASGTPDADAAELRAIDSIYATSDRPAAVMVGAAASQFGNCGAASGIVSLVKAVAEVELAEMLPVVGLHHPADFAQDNAGRVIAAQRTELKSCQADGRLLAGVNAVSPSGAAYHVVLERPTPVAPPKLARRPVADAASVGKVTNSQSMQSPTLAASATWTLSRFSAPNWESLHANLMAVSRGDSFQADARFSPGDRIRAAVVAHSIDDFRERCARGVELGIEAGHVDQLAPLGIFCGTAEPGRASLPVDQEITGLLASFPTLAATSETDLALQHVLTARAWLEVAGVLDPYVAPSVAAPAVMTGLIAGPAGIDVVRLAGTPWEMGYQQGKALSRAIRVVLRRYADQAGTRWDPGSALDEAAGDPSRFFTADELEELRGIAKGADVSAGSVISHSLRLLLDGGAGGAHFVVQDEAGGLLHGYNEDLRQSVSVRDCVARTVQVRIPNEGFPHVLFSPVGMAGGLSGQNSHGIAASATCLLDVASRATGGRLLSGIVRDVLVQADTIDRAVEIVRSAAVRIPFTLCLSDAANRRALLIEADGVDIRIHDAGERLIAVNHRDGSIDAPSHSRNRHERLAALLGNGPITLAAAQAALRDLYDASRQRESQWPTMNTVRRVDNQIGVVFHTGGIALTPGPMANGHQNQFAKLEALIPQPHRPCAGGEMTERLPSDVMPHDATPCDVTSNDAKSHANRLANSPSVISPPGQARWGLSAAEVAAAYAASPENTGRVCERLVLRMMPSPAATPPAGAAVVSGSAIVFGANPLAEALTDELRRRSVPVTRIATDDPDASLAEIDAAWSLEPATALFLCPSHDGQGPTVLEHATWKARRDAGALLPYRVCQRWYQRVADANRLAEATLVAVTSLGGDFGLSGRNIRVEGGALTGLVKGVAMEVALGKGIATGFRGKSIDVADGTPPAAAAAFICDELARDRDGSEPEVALANGERLVVRPIPQPVAALPMSDLPRGATFVVTGGARGVTAVVARELGLRYRLKLHLIGSSPKPEIAESYHRMSADELKEVKSSIMKEALATGEKPADAWSRFEKALEIDRSLRELRGAGVNATYHGCDVSDRAALGGVLDAIRQADGPIVGVIHGAGFERASRFEKKQIDLVDRTLAAKVDGAAALMELTASDPLRWFAAFGSVAGRFGGVGQTDYCAANDMLAKLIDWYRGQRPEVGAAVFHWHAWDDVGMAVRPESAHIRKMHNIRFMPSREGANHLLNELRAGLPEGEVAITELATCREKYAGRQPSTVADAASVGKLVTEDPPRQASTLAASATKHPLIDRVVELAPGRRVVAEVDLHPQNDLFLARHLYKGRPMMPVVATIEALVEAAQLAAGPSRKIVAIRDIQILNGLRFSTERPQTARMRVAAEGNVFSGHFTSDVVNRAGKTLRKDQPYLQCVIETSDRPITLDDVRPPLPSTWHDVWYPDTDTVIYHGEEFRCLKRGIEENGVMWGAFVAPAHGNLSGRRGGEGWIMPSALIDAGFYGSGVMLWVKTGGAVAIPAGIDGILLGRPARAGEECTGVFTDRGREGNHALYDFTIFGDDGGVICRVEGYRNVIVAEQPTAAASP